MAGLLLARGLHFLLFLGKEPEVSALCEVEFECLEEGLLGELLGEEVEEEEAVLVLVGERLPHAQTA